MAQIIAFPTKNNGRRYNENGVSRFESENLNACRDFLRDRGLEINKTDVYKGWSCNGFRGLIDFSNGYWNAAYWRVTEMEGELSA